MGTFDSSENYVIEETVFYSVREVPCQVRVSFGVPYPDWCELQRLPCWGQVAEFLAQKKSTDNRGLHIAQGGL